MVTQKQEKDDDAFMMCSNPFCLLAARNGSRYLNTRFPYLGMEENLIVS